MKNKSESRTKRLIGRIFNVRSWIDYDRIRAGQKYILNTASTYFVPQDKKATESFDKAMARLKLTDADILARQTALLRTSIIIVGMAFAIFCYAIYNLFHAHYIAALLSVVVMLLALSLAFRYHFWYFQIKQHKLGCTLSEWFKQGLMGAKK